MYPLVSLSDKVFTMKKLNILLVLTLFFVSACSDEDKDNNNDNNDPPNHQDYHYQSVGTSAEDMTTDESFKTIIVDLVHVEGHAPSQEALNTTEQFLSETLDKPGGISFSISTIPSPGKESYSSSDIRDIEDDYRTLKNEGDQLAIFAFYADQHYTSNESVLGIAYLNTSIALFSSQIESNSGGLNQPSKSLLEATVLNHEFGHLLGLVNNGTPMQTDHQDEANGHHCDNEDCLMYWSVETSDALGNLIGNDNPPPLGEECTADLQAY